MNTEQRELTKLAKALKAYGYDEQSNVIIKMASPIGAVMMAGNALTGGGETPETPETPATPAAPNPALEQLIQQALPAFKQLGIEEEEARTLHGDLGYQKIIEFMTSKDIYSDNNPIPFSHDAGVMSKLTGFAAGMMSLKGTSIDTGSIIQVIKADPALKDFTGIEESPHWADGFSSGVVDNFKYVPIAWNAMNRVMAAKAAANKSRAPGPTPARRRRSGGGSAAESMADISGGLITDAASGNEFRKWVNDNHEVKARQLDLDRTGKWNNSYMKRAWAALGEQYKAYKSGGEAGAGGDQADSTEVSDEDLTNYLKYSGERLTLPARDALVGKFGDPGPATEAIATTLMSRGKPQVLEAFNSDKESNPDLAMQVDHWAKNDGAEGETGETEGTGEEANLNDYYHGDGTSVYMRKSDGELFYQVAGEGGAMELLPLANRTRDDRARGDDFLSPREQRILMRTIRQAPGMTRDRRKALKRMIIGTRQQETGRRNIFRPEARRRRGRGRVRRNRERLQAMGPGEEAQE